MKTLQDWAVLVGLWFVVAVVVAVVAGRFLRICRDRNDEVELSPETFDAADRARE